MEVTKVTHKLHIPMAKRHPLVSQIYNKYLDVYKAQRIVINHAKLLCMMVVKP